MKKTFRFHPFSLLILFLLVAGSLVQAIDVELEYDRYKSNSNLVFIQGATREYQPRGYKMLDKLTELPDGDWKLPELKCQIPAYGLFELSGKKYLLILDKKEKKDTFFNRLYFDANANKDLTDDKVIDVKKQSGLRTLSTMKMAQFPAVDINLSSTKQKLPYSFRVVAYFRGEIPEAGLSESNIKSSSFTFYTMNNCCYRGSFKYKDKEYRLILNDLNSNGTFDDTSGLPEKGVKGQPPSFDMFYLSTNKTVGYKDRNYFGDMLVLKGQLFQVKVDLPDKKLSLTPYNGNTVTVQSSLDIERMTLFSARGKHSFMIYKGGESFALLPGEYSLFDYEAFKKDEQGDLWSISARSTSEVKPIKITKKDTALKFGEPFAVKVNIKPGAYKKFEGLDPKPQKVGSIPLAFSIEGAAGEQVSDLRRVSGTKTRIPLSKKRNYRPKEPQYLILKQSGELVNKGSFEYG